MKSTTKKWLTVAGCLAVCAVLVFVIAKQFDKAPVTDAPLPGSSTEAGDVEVNKPQVDNTENNNALVVNPIKPEASQTEDASGAVSTGTEQTIQPDPVKPEPDEDALKDPTQKPDGTPVEGTPTPEDHNTVTPPSNPPGTNTSGGLPGFDNVPDGGANQVIDGESDGDINKQVGIMG